MVALRSRRSRKWFWLGVGAVALLVAVVSALVYLRQPATERLRADIAAQMPIGSTRERVDQYLESSGLNRGIFANDYPSGDPREGMLIVGVVPEPVYFRRIRDIIPAFGVQGPYFAFHFDKKGPDGKLIRTEVSGNPIPIPPP